MSHHWLGVAAVGAVAVLFVGCSGTPSPRPDSSAPPASAATSAPESVTSAAGWIAYQGLSERGPDGIFLVRPDGTEDHEILLDLSGRRLHPDFSPDGSMLAFDQSDGDVDNLYVAAADGSSPRLVVECTPPDCLQRWEPSWSPDGTRLAIATANHTDPMLMGIAVVDVATGAVAQIVEHPQADGQDHFPRWSPDGSHLVFWRGSASEDEGGAAIFIVATDGSGLTQLTDSAMIAGDPDFSPDGTRILFGTRPLLSYQGSGQSELYTMASDGTDQQQLTNYGPDGQRATQPRWTPDGTAILYVRTNQTGHPRELYAISADGSDDGPVATEKDVYTHPSLQPAS